MKTRLLICLTAAALLTGCAPQDTRPQRGNFDLLLQPAPGFITVQEKAEYQELAFMAIAERMEDPDEFAGMGCELRLTLNRDARLTKIKALDGDPALCRAAIAASQVATFPRFASDAEARTLHYMDISFTL